MGKIYRGRKDWTRTFEKYCPYTSTHLWWGIEEVEYDETRMREDLRKWDSESIRGKIKGDVSVSVFKYFIQCEITVDFLREIVEQLDQSMRRLLEDTVYDVMIKKDLRHQNCVVNCINYVKDGLVKYNEELKTLKFT